MIVYDTHNFDLFWGQIKGDDDNDNDDYVMMMMIWRSLGSVAVRMDLTVPSLSRGINRCSARLRITWKSRLCLFLMLPLTVLTACSPFNIKHLIH